MTKKHLYPIRYVSRQTGLTPHVIRIWEKRYGAVVPKRTDTNRRLYSEDDIERLTLLKQATQKGNAIGHIAALKRKELRGLASHGDVTPPSRVTPNLQQSGSLIPADLCETCVNAVIEFDAAILENALNRSAIELNRIALLEQVVVPLIQKIGELWSQGALKIFHEHMASSIIRTYLGDLLRFSDPRPSAPNIVVATPRGQHHELGALIVAVAAAAEGWRVTYLGINLPSEEIAGAAEKTHAKAVCLSLVFPGDDPKLILEIKKLRRYLSQETELIIGGQSADAYARQLKASDATVIQGLPELLEFFRSLL